jgi:cation diffusion facilitator family transporter
MADTQAGFAHDHVFLGKSHESAERRTWAVIWLCAVMMFLEIAGGLIFGSIALVADGLHMSTHAGALLLAAMAYRCARRYCGDSRFTFGTGKFGDLAGFTSAIVLSMISLLIGYEAIDRLFHPAQIRFAEAIPIACLGLAVNVASVWLLSDDHDHDHGHGHHHDHEHHHHHDDHHDHMHADAKTGRDNNMRAAIVHVIADALVSVLVIVGLLLARFFGWVWMDPVAGLIGAGVIASWAYGLVRDTGGILLDMTPDREMAKALRETIETDGDQLADLHLWRLGPGHLGAIVSVITPNQRNVSYYQTRLNRFSALSHLTIQVQHAA